MQNRFGLKDFVVLLLLIGLIVSVWLGTYAEDRRFERVGEVQSGIERIERMVGRTLQNIEFQGDRRAEEMDRLLDNLESLTDEIAYVARRLEQGVVVADGEAGARHPERDRAERAPRTRGRDDSWARPGYEITWSQPWQFVNDPREAEGFQPGGEFHEIFNAQPPIITPLTYRDVYGRHVNDQVIEFLARYDPDTLELRGVLADAWQYDPDGMWLRVRINSRARFSDGTPVTTDDVLFTFEQMMNPEIEADRFRAVHDPIEEVVVIDERVVEFRFKEPMFVNLSAALVFPVLPEHFYERFTPSEFNQSTGLLMGSGPFRLARLDPNDQWTAPNHVRLVRNEDYWAQTPPLERLRFSAIASELSRLTAYNNDEADMITPSSRQYRSMELREDWQENNVARKWYNIRGGYNFIIWNCRDNRGTKTPFTDQRVRLAMTHLLDRERIIRDIQEGIGTVATGPFNPTTPQANPDIEPWPYDMDRARQLLAEAGWEDRNGDGWLEDEDGRQFRFEFTYSTGAEATERLARYLRDQCRAVGIRCDLRPVDWSVYSEILTTRTFDAITMGWAPSAPEGDPYQIWHSDQIDNQGDNYAQWANEDADRLIEKGRRTLDDAERMKVWHQLHSVIHEEQPYTFLSDRPWVRFTKKRVGNFQEYKTGVEYREFFIFGGGIGSAPTAW